MVLCVSQKFYLREDSVNVDPMHVVLSKCANAYTKARVVYLLLFYNSFLPGIASVIAVGIAQKERSDNGKDFGCQRVLYFLSTPDAR